MNAEASAWITAVDGLAEVHARLRRVVILNHDALDVIREQDGPKTLFYLDPPYMHSTRTAKKTYGDYEMADDVHLELLRLIVDVEGLVFISGYRNELYDAALANWHCYEFEQPNNAAGGDTKRRMVECVWSNRVGA